MRRRFSSWRLLDHTDPRTKKIAAARTRWWLTCRTTIDINHLDGDAVKVAAEWSGPTTVEPANYQMMSAFEGKADITFFEPNVSVAHTSPR